MSQLRGQISSASPGPANGRFVDPSAALQDYKAALNPVNKIRPANPLDQIDNDAFNIHWIEQLLEYGQVEKMR